MAVPVMRYQRYKDLSDKSSPQKYYLKQEPGSSKTATIIGKSNRVFFQNDWYKKTLSICQK